VPRPTDPATGSRAGRRRGVLAVLRAAQAPLGAADIADRLGVHPNTVRFHLDRLCEEGQVHRVPLPPTGRGRPGLAFAARRGMDASGPRDYRLLAELLADGLAELPDVEARITAAGRAHGARLAGAPAVPAVPADESVDRLVGLLDGLGFAPERRPADHGWVIGLRHCPFIEVVRTVGTSVCRAHLGLMQGAMSALRAPVVVEGLEPFAEPDLCLAHLRPTDAPSDPEGTTWTPSP
jgi:predicted ArsR family transcriptional regulator